MTAAAPRLDRVGCYLVGRTLGHGAFCKVYLGEHETTKQKVAIKVLNRKKLKQMDMLGKIRTEIEVMRIFVHPHIVRLYEVIETPTDIFVVMEYCAGGELFDHIVSRGRLDETEGRRMFQEIVSGVEYCHTHMVVHRDLKPENLLLDEHKHVKLGDFGLSSIARDGCFLKTSCGSPNYAAPEIINGNMYSGPEVDVWSCGVILYAILCGSLPFDDEKIRNLFRKIKAGTYTIPSYVSAGARDLLSKMLLVDPLHRMTISEIREHYWFQIGLPPYLAVSPQQQLLRAQEIDDSAVAKVVALGFPKESILEALSLGSELVTKKNQTSQQMELRKLAVLYNLATDERRRKELEFIHLKPGPVEVSNHENHETKQKEDDVLRPSVSSRRWFVGREYGAEPGEIMTELYNALKRLNFEWKSPTTFKVKCRYPMGRRVPNAEVSKLIIFCYKTPKGACILDFQKTYGQAFLFLDLCGRLISELRVAVAQPSPPALYVGPED